jgi:hypothetical protein
MLQIDSDPLATVTERHPMKLLHFFSIPLSLGLTLGCQNAKFTAEGKKNPGICTDGQEYVGANFVFMVDNSGSMGVTDCPTGDIQSCGQTYRERAILNAFDILTEASEASEYATKAMSTVSIAQFTPQTRNATLNEFDWNLLTVSSFPEDRDDLEAALQFTRAPSGDTPYLNALSIAQTIVQGDALNEDQQTVIVLVTDGDPTDRNPDEVRQLAQSIDAKIMTIRVTPQDWTQDMRRSKHLETISRYYADWSEESYPSTEAYTDDLLQLVTDISKDGVYEVSEAKQLEAGIFDNIISQTVPCLN